MRLNLGCGEDRRPDFINVDGNEMYSPDEILCLGRGALTDRFAPGTVHEVLANDIIEHLFHWEAMKVLKEIYAVLVNGGILTLRLPDFAVIIGHPSLSDEEKILALFGGQDRPQGEKNPEARAKYPEFFCHKFAYTKRTMAGELSAAGFQVLSVGNEGTNMIIRAKKGE